MNYEIHIEGSQDPEKNHRQSETIEQQIERQLREGKKPNSLTDVVGKWPGDETEEEFEELLKMLRE